MPRRSTVHRLSAAAVAAAGALVAGVLAAPPAYAATVSIADVQGSALLSPLAGQSATVEGVVTGDHRTGGYRGIYVQTEGSGGATDATPGRSDGIFVFVGNRTFDLAIGDKVRVTGPVSDFSSASNPTDIQKVTQISVSSAQTGSIERLGVGVLPQPTALPATVLGNAREAFEGMLVRPTGTYKLVSTHNAQNFGELWTSAGSAMPVEAFETAVPGTTAANNITTANNNARLLAADANTRLYFQPNADYNGTLANAITFRAWDQTSGSNGSLADASSNGGITAFSAITDVAVITVTAVNDAPIASGSATLAAINEDTASPTGATVSSLFSSNFSDAGRYAGTLSFGTTF